MISIMLLSLSVSSCLGEMGFLVRHCQVPRWSSALDVPWSRHGPGMVYKSGWWFQPTPLKNITSSVGVILPNVWKNKTCSKPPTSYCHNPFQSCKPCVGRANCSSISRWYRYGCMIQLSTMAYDGMR